MKIRLERKHHTCVDRLRCVVCHQPFYPGKIRTLLYNHANLIQGDVCPVCLTLKSQEFKHLLWQRSQLLTPSAGLDAHQIIALHERAFELAETAQEPISFPKWWQWLLKELEIFIEEYQEMKTAHYGWDRQEDFQRSQLERIYRGMN